MQCLPARQSQRWRAAKACRMSRRFEAMRDQETETALREVASRLVEGGFEVYQTVGNRVDVAERVRDNLLMDANVSVLVQGSLRVRFATRAQRCDFPASHETPEVLFARARSLATHASSNGFREVGTEVVQLADPSDSTRVLDTWYLVLFDKAAADLQEMVAVVRDAMSVEKVVPR